MANSLDEPVMHHQGHHHHSFNLSNWPSSTPPVNTGRSPNAEDIRQLQAMLAVVGGERRHTSFVPGVYCAFTEDTVREFQLHNGLEVSGEVDDKTWDVLGDQVAYRKRKEEERAVKREEAHKKAKQEQERKLQQQKEESARAMDNIMEKTLSSMGVRGGKSIVAAPPASPTVAVSTTLLQPPPNSDFPAPYQ